MKTKKILALFMAVVMVFGLCTTAFAATGEKVQINNMMVDASLVEAEHDVPTSCSVAEEVFTDMYVERLADAANLTSATSVNYPPIAQIAVGSNSSINVTDDGTNIQYVLHVPNGSTTGTQNFVFTPSTSTSYSSLVVTYGGQPFPVSAEGTTTIAMTLSNGTTSFDASWLNNAGVSCTQHCTLTIDISTSVAIYESSSDVGVYVTNITGATADLDATSVGGVTRYTCAITLPAGSSNTGVNVQFKLASSGANATLSGETPDSSKVNVPSKTKTVTFNNVDFSSTKELVVTNGTTSRTYVVSAVAAGSTVTVHIAIRTFLADEWLNGLTTWYSGYTDNGLTQSDRASLLATAAYLRSANSPTPSSTVSAYNGNAPLSPDTSTTNGRFVFSEASYVTLTVPANYKVRDVLNAFTSDTTYFPNGFSIQGSSSYIEAMGQTASSVIGEFDCGYASGWMYTARTARDDVTTALPDAGANTWPISNGMYIDWYYTAAYGTDFGYSMYG